MRRAFTLYVAALALSMTCALLVVAQDASSSGTPPPTTYQDPTKTRLVNGRIVGPAATPEIIHSSQSGAESTLGTRARPGAPGRPYKRNWLVYIGVIGLIILYFYSRHYSATAAKKPAETGKLATLQEQQDVYGLPWAKGGYLLGRAVPQAHNGPTSIPARVLALAASPRSEAYGPNEDESILRIPFDLRTRHVITEASTGAGKTTSMIIPQLIEDGASGICNDFLIDRKSPEMFQQVAGSWLSHGRRVIFFDPWDKGLTWGFEPLFGASPSTIRAMTEAHVQISFDPADTTKFYREQERALIQTLFECAQEWGKEDRRLGTLPAVAELVALGYETTRAAIERVRPDLNRRLVDQWRLSDGDLGKIFRSIFARLSVYLIPEVAAAFSRSDFTVNDIVVPFEKGNQTTERTLLIVGANQATGAAGELIASFITQLIMHAVYERGMKMKRAGKRWTDVVPLAQWFDEIGSYALGRWEDFLAVARDGGVAITSALQDRLQFDRINGREASIRLMKNHTHKIYMRGVDFRVAEDLSREIGNEWIIDEGRSASRGRTPMGRTAMASTQKKWVERPIRTPDQITRIPQDRAFVFGATDPFEIELVPFYQSPILSTYVQRSTEYFIARRARNEQCDREHVLRPKGEPQMLEAQITDWTPVVGEEMMATGMAGRKERRPKSGASSESKDEPMTKKDRNVIDAKFRDLQQTEADIERLTQKLFQLSLNQLQKSHAPRLIQYLTVWEEREGKTKKTQTRRSGPAGSGDDATPNPETRSPTSIWGAQQSGTSGNGASSTANQ